MSDEFEITVWEHNDQIPAGRPPEALPRQWYGNPDTTEVCIYCRQTVIQAIEKHARSDGDNEIGGVLLGTVCMEDGRIYVTVDAYLAAPVTEHNQNSRTHFNFSSATWSYLNNQIDHIPEYGQYRIVGWFHSHPGHGIFLSADPGDYSSGTPISDEFIHKHFFKRPWQIALVYDPLQHQAGFFIWDKGIIIRAPGFIEVQDIDQSKSLVTWNKNQYQPRVPPNYAPPSLNSHETQDRRRRSINPWSIGIFAFGVIGIFFLIVLQVM